MSRESSIFLASSPRHLLLFAGLALNEGTRRNQLFFIEHIPAAGVDGYLSALAAWEGSPFHSAERLKGDYRPLLAAGDSSASKRELKWRFRRENGKRLEEAIRASRPTRLYAGCDDFYESQDALRLATRLNPTVRSVYVEDGVSAYSYSFRKQHVRIWPKELTRKLRHGPWWQPTLLPGTFRMVSGGVCGVSGASSSEAQAAEVEPASRRVTWKRSLRRWMFRSRPSLAACRRSTSGWSMRRRFSGSSE